MDINTLKTKLKADAEISTKIVSTNSRIHRSVKITKEIEDIMKKIE